MHTRAAFLFFMVFGTIASPFAESQTHIIHGQSGPLRLGRSLRSVGDLDGDGIPDLAATTTHPFYDPYPMPSQTLVYSGQTGQLIHTIGFGRDVAPMGDVDGDGVDDLLIVADKSVSTSFGLSDLVIVSGSDASTILIFHLPPPYGGLERGVCSFGDLNGDGVHEIVVTTRKLTFPVPTPALHVLDGATRQVLNTQISTGFLPLDLGVAMDNVGDVDGDGVDDLAASEILWNPSLTGAGVRVISGADFSTIHLLANAGTFAGFSVSRLGDVDGDGHMDILVGNGGGVPFAGPYLWGSVQIYSGATGLMLTTIAESQINSGFGSTVAGLGDVNGDGSPDFAVGAAGIATPSGLGQVFVYSGTNGSPILTLDNPSSAAGFGGSLARAGDLDGDGLPDLAVCAISLTGPSWIGAFGFTRTGCIAGTSAVPVLQVNGDASPFQFTCLAQPMVITLDQPASQLIPSNWVLWGMLAPFSSQTQYGIPPVLCLLPQHLFPSNPALFTLGNAFYPADPLAVVPGVHAAPFAFHVPGGIPVATTFSLQGLIEDAASYPAPWAVTNGIQVTVH